jgi:hypothetical protein
MSTKGSAADLIAELTSTGELELPRRVRAAMDQRLRSTLDDRACVPASVSQPVLGVLLDAADDAAVVEHEEDPLLEPILFQAIFSTNIDLRVRASSVLAASPFREAVANGIGQLLSADLGKVGSAVAPLAGALGELGESEHRAVLESLLVKARFDAGVVSAVATALGHLPGTTPATLWTGLLSASEADESTHRAVLYAAGMNRDSAFLDLVDANPSYSEQVRSGARWWRGLGRDVAVGPRT